MQDNVTEWVKNVEKFIADTEIEQDIMGKHVPIKKTNRSFLHIVIT